LLKKRIIFSLLYDDGNFVLSRNFRRQIVGDLDWLKRNYDFSSISFYIDELIVLDITKGTKNSKHFLKTLESIAESCFAPISSGGGINSLSDAKNFLNSGADKIIINSLVHKDIQTTENLSIKFGQQCITLSLDIKKLEKSILFILKMVKKR
jgi:cyclase